MKKHMEFGECLGMMLSALEIKSSSIARVLSIDASLVNRWIHGKRVPAYRSNYIECIAEYISYNILNSFQKKKLNDILESIDINLSNSMDVKEKVKKVLLEAQGHSIETRRLEHKSGAKNCKKQVPPGDLPPVLNNPYKFCSPNQSKPPINDEALFDDYLYRPDTSVKRIVELSEEDKIILGANSILNTVLDLLKNAAQDSSHHSKTIYITYGGEIDVLMQYSNIKEQLRYIFHDLLNRGWSIIALLRINNDLKRLIGFARFMYPLLRTGNFTPYYIKKYDTISNGTEFIVIPGIGALTWYTANLISDADSAFYFKNQLAVKILLKHLNKTIYTSAQPLVRYFPIDKLAEFLNEAEVSAKSYGSKYLFKDGLSILTLPLPLYKEYLKRRNLSPGVYKDKLQRHKARLDSFHSNLKNNKCKDIYTIEAIEKLINKGQYPADHYYGAENIRATPEEVIRHLKHIIYLLKRFNNYEIALINNRQNISRTDLYWMVKEKHSVKLEIWGDKYDSPKQNISIEEPTTVKAFEEYFVELWESIAPVNRTRKEIIQWLEEKILMMPAE